MTVDSVCRLRGGPSSSRRSVTGPRGYALPGESVLRIGGQHQLLRGGADLVERSAHARRRRLRGHPPAFLTASDLGGRPGCPRLLEDENARLPAPPGDRVAVAVDQPVRDKGENQGIPFPPGVGSACRLADFLRGRGRSRAIQAYFVSRRSGSWVPLMALYAL